MKAQPLVNAIVFVASLGIFALHGYALYHWRAIRDESINDGRMMAQLLVAYAVAVVAFSALTMALTIAAGLRGWANPPSSTYIITATLWLATYVPFYIAGILSYRALKILRRD